jgi:transcriptional regulator with PAS, ATPase and Fis domain
MRPFPHIQTLMSRPLDFVQLLDEIPLGVIVLDTDRRVVHLNQHFQAITGMDIKKALGIHCGNILRSGACITNCPVLTMNGTHRSITCQSDIINMDRQKLPIQLTCAPILDTDGIITGYIETVENLTSKASRTLDQEAAYSFANIIGRCEKMASIFQTLPMLAQSETSILITGETGTGKDLVAEAIHQTSQRAAGPFIKINCGALPETLLESELFGHTKGAFTGAVENKPGRFKLAHNGTIFLTEIGDLPLALQVKLLTFLDDKVIYPLGGTKGFDANVRILAATHRNLEEMVDQGKFRKDLLFRLNVARIHLPPLREREGDIRLLLDHFFSHYTRLISKDLDGFSTDALACLMTYGYEGNIRELKNIVEYAVNVTQSPQIETQNLPAYLLDSSPSPTLPPNRIPAPKAPSPQVLRAQEKDMSPTATWSQVHREMILEALKASGGKKQAAARRLGISRSTLWRNIRKYNIQ